ncbi:MAG: MBL fold metallo-hydrolase [Chloroflexi bacterium]|nr:MBL fold metallo-hydrolase [Chloroflexota bacterium]
MSESVTEATPGVFQLHIPIPDNPLGYTLPYLVTGPEGHVLIDTGWNSPAGEEALRDQLVGQLGVKPGSVKHIILTHWHPDHSGLTPTAKEMTGAPVTMHRVDWETWMPRLTTTPGFAEEMVSWHLGHGYPETELEGLAPPWARRQAHPTPHQAHRPHEWGIAKPDFLAEGGESLVVGPLKLEVVWTPGHTAGHICLYDRGRRLVFTGDHVLPVITSNVSLQHHLGGDPLGDYLRSLEKVAALDADLVLPAHEYHFSGLKERVEQVKHHHDYRLQAVMKATAGGSKTAYHIAERVPWDVGSWGKMNSWLRRAALAETLAHLEHLRLQGKVVQSQVGRYIHFALAEEAAAV